MSSPVATGTPLGGVVTNAIRRLAAAAGLLLLLAASTAPLFAVSDLAAAEHGTVAVVFAPGTAKPTAVAAVVEAGGLLLGEGGWNNVLMVHSDESGFAGRLRRAGAWLVLDPRSSVGCLAAGRASKTI